jgi:hypothetical protein
MKRFGDDDDRLESLAGRRLSEYLLRVLEVGGDIIKTIGEAQLRRISVSRQENQLGSKDSKQAFRESP